jgi:hypothetical protein
MAKQNRGSQKPKDDNSKGSSKYGRYANRGGRKPSPFERSVNDPKAYINNYTQDKDNDPAWYTVNGTLVNDAAKLPFGNMVGEPIPFSKGEDTEGTHELNVAGFAVMRTRPTIGYSRDETSAPSRAAVAMTEFLRSKLTTDESFATQDTLMYTNAIDSILALYSHITRCFGLLGAVKFNNLYTPKYLVQAIYNFDDDAWNDAVQNRANLTLKFNQYVTEAQFLFLPVSYTAIQRHSWLFSNVFYDSRSNKAQMYAHAPVGFYIWDEVTSDRGTTNRFLKLDPSDTTNPYRAWYKENTLDALIELFHKMCYAMINSTSQLRIRMAFLKAYGESAGWRMASLADNYLISPVHSDEVLSQINNTTICSVIESYGYTTSYDLPEGTKLPDGTVVSGTYSTDPFDVVGNPDNNTIECVPFVAIGQLNAQNLERIKQKEIANFHWDNPSTEDILVATRDMVTFEYSTYPLNIPSYNLTGMGSDVVTGFEMYYIDSHHNLNKCELEYSNRISLAAVKTSLKHWSTFDWAPTMWMEFSSSASGTQQVVPVQEWDNCNAIEEESLIQLHKAVLTSMYQVKEAGMYSI